MRTSPARSRTSSSRRRRWTRRWPPCRTRRRWREPGPSPSTSVQACKGRSPRGDHPGRRTSKRPTNRARPMSDFNIARPRVLVADPDPETSALLARALDWSGYEVTTAANGREALELTTRLRPAAAVLEVTMEILNGYHVVRELREAGHRQPIVMISARAGKLDRDFAFT